MSYQKLEKNGNIHDVLANDPESAIAVLHQRRIHRRRFMGGLTCSLMLIVMAVFIVIQYGRGGKDRSRFFIPRNDHHDDDDDYWGHNDDDDDAVAPPPYHSDIVHNNTASDEPLQPGCEATMLIMRHCEKTGPLTISYNAKGHRVEHCSYVGMERSAYLTTLFGTKWPVPSYLYALSPIRGKHENRRELETLRPLSEKLNLEIDSRFEKSSHLAQDFLEKLNTGMFCGKLIVVSYKHSMIKELSRELKCMDCPKKYRQQFDEIWQLKFVYDVVGGMNNHHHRQLKKHEHKPISTENAWSVYSTVAYQNFDALEYSKKIGDYPDDGGMAVGGKWKDADNNDKIITTTDQEQDNGDNGDEM